MQNLTKEVADLAAHLLNMRTGQGSKTVELDTVEKLAQQVLTEVSAARRRATGDLGEITGQWPAFSHLRLR